MAKSCRPGSKPKRSLQTFDDAQAEDTRKKTKVAVLGEGLDAPRRSSRSNIGKGGQKLQLENLERAQMQGTTRVSRLATTVANEPLNPMALMAIDAGPPASKESVDRTAAGESWSHPSARPAPLPTYQSAMENSRYGFNISAREKSSLGSPDLPPSNTMISFTTPGVRSQPVVSTASRHDPTNQTHHVRGLPTPTSSRDRSIAPGHTGSAVPSSRTASVSSSRGGSLAPVSHGGSMAPSPSSVPTVVSYSTVVAGSHVHQQLRKPSKVTRTYSVHGHEDMGLSRHSLDPPRYDNDDYALSDEREGEDSAKSYGQPPIDELPIDEASPDEDERVAQSALRGVHGPHSGSHRIPASQEVPPPLDEASSDEDEGITQSILRGRRGRPAARQIPDDSQIDPSLLEQPRNDVHGDRSIAERHWVGVNPEDARDVIHEYHQRNRFPRPPDPSSLRDIRVRSAHGTMSVASPVHASAPVPMPREQALLPQDVSAAESPKYPLEGDPTKLRTYPVAVRPFIEQAKLIAQCNSAFIHPFLSRTDFLRKSFEFYTEAWAEVASADIPQGIWPHYQKDLGVLLWEAMMSWRSTLKAKAREIVPRHYALNENRIPEENKAEATELLRGSAFTYDIDDDDGSANNMAAPALHALIQSFFYHGPSSLAVKFPNVFAAEVPSVTVCLAATALRTAIDEYTKSGVREDRNFEYQGYSKIFASFCSMQQAIDRDPKHAEKTKKLRVEWARTSNFPANEPGNIIALENDFVPLLN